ncbi:hypothetical protein B0H11DRAFT_2377579 [Mycena galericulata]|nr:hypothetical protein B0H11DRAFT_2377579 [Mycena galericulata]
MSLLLSSIRFLFLFCGGTIADDQIALTGLGMPASSKRASAQWNSAQTTSSSSAHLCCDIHLSTSTKPPPVPPMPTSHAKLPRFLQYPLQRDRSKSLSFDRLPSAASSTSHSTTSSTCSSHRSGRFLGLGGGSSKESSRERKRERAKRPPARIPVFPLLAPPPRRENSQWETSTHRDPSPWPAAFHAAFYARVWCTYRTGFETICD